MNRGDKAYIWQQPDWPLWRYNAQRLASLLTQVHHAQGLLLGRMRNLGLGQSDQATLSMLTSEVLKTSEIEGELLDPDTVRSSIARRLGLEVGAVALQDRRVDGVVDMVLDATQNFKKPLTRERLFGWHAGLFPTGYSGDTKIRVGDWRDDAAGPMQVVSGPMGREKAHYEAPPAELVPKEMSNFLNWFNEDQDLDLFVKSGLAHLWFVTIHPFEDGNGRVGRAVCDMILARSEQSAQRFYSLSAQIGKERKNYYNLLVRTQKDSLDVTEWLEWFLKALLRAMQGAEELLNVVLTKARFWQHWAGTSFNPRQINLLNGLLDGFDGNLTSKKWAVIAKCSPDTALRDITDLITKGVLMRTPAGGRSTHYKLKPLD
ncbi:MAG TPA: Fic family protein [Candidatus Paceibacterota bacterium]|nr:Fic family protein [Candidatus Paceibacterota bacterium]